MMTDALDEAFPPCLYCGEMSYEPFFVGVQDRLGYVPGHWSFRRCVDCGSAMLSPPPRTSDLATYYPAVYSFHPGVASPRPLARLVTSLEQRAFYRPYYLAQARRLCQGLGNQRLEGMRVLDLGCGNGMLLQALRDWGLEVQGIDFHPGAVAHVHESLGIEAVCADIADLPCLFPAESFDIISAFHLLEHVPGVPALLKAAYNLLKPGGWFVAAVPLVDSLQASVFGSRWLAVTEAPRHVTLPSREGLRRLCFREGFEAITLRPDSVLSCASVLALSLLPGSATPLAYSRRGRGRVLLRVLGGILTLLAIPWCVIENHVLHRPAAGIVFARKPRAS